MRAGMASITLGFAAVSCGAAPPTGKPAEWRVMATLHGKAKGGEVKIAEDVSGMACAPEEGGRRLCLLVDDETQGAQVVVLDPAARTLSPGDYIPLIQDQFEGKPVELDAEGAAYGGGAFYVIGSHGRPRHEKEGDEGKTLARQSASSHIFRIRFARNAVDISTGAIRTAPTIDTSTALSGFFPVGSILARQAGVPLDDNGMTVEGFAVRGSDGLIGFRAPIDGSEALVLEIPLTDLFGGAGRQGAVRRLCLGLDGRGNPRGIRDLAVVGTTVFGIAGPVNDPAKEATTADYAVFRLTEDGKPALLPLGDRVATVKPEGLVPLSGGSGRFEGLLLYDGVAYGTPQSAAVRSVSLDFTEAKTSTCADPGGAPR